MKKIAILTVFAASSIMLVGCGKKDTPTQEKTQPVTNTQTVKPTNDSAQSIETGDTVKINYVGRSEEAGLFDTNKEEIAKKEGTFIPERTYEPLEFTVGAGMMIPGMEQGVIGMTAGETKTLTVEADQAYGQYREDLIQELPSENFVNAGIDPVVGETYNFGIAQGTVKTIGDDTVTLDFNHELAGQVLTFEVTVIEVIKNAPNA